MNILIVTQYFWPESFQINDLAVGMEERGHQVTVLTGIPNYPEGHFFEGYGFFKNRCQTYKGIDVYRIPLVPRGSKGAFRLAINYLSFVFFGLLFSPWLLRGRKYDSIFVYGVSPILQAIPAIYLGWLKHCPVTIHIQDLWPESLAATGYVCNLRILAGVGWIVRYIYRHSDLLLVQSRAFKPHVEGMAHGKSVVYFPNSVDSSFFAPSTVPLPDISVLSSGFPVVFAGNVGAGQAVEVIVDAACFLKEHRDIKFVVFGQGSRWEWMRQEIQARGLTNLHLLGRFPVETMPGLMQKAAVLLVTLTDQPIFAMTVPNKVQAYMASGRPILASLNGEGASLVIEAEAGLAVPANDAKALADAVLQLYGKTTEELERLGSNGRYFCQKNFDPDQLVDQLIEHLRTVS